MKHSNNVKNSGEGICPMHKAAQATDIIREQCLGIFGPQNLAKENMLGTIHGSVFIDFLSDFKTRMGNIEIINPMEMTNITIPNGPTTKEFLDAMEEAHGIPQISRLGNTLFKRFCNSYGPKVTAKSGTPQEIYQSSKLASFGGLSSAFIQAFDAVLITAAEKTNNLEEWEKTKGDMWKIFINLARIPSSIQESLLGDVGSFNNISSDSTYLVTRIGEMWEIMKDNPEIAFGDAFMAQSIKGGYGECPAIKDRTLKLSFHLMFEIYGKILIKPKES